jgi:hypothetical protein
MLRRALVIGAAAFLAASAIPALGTERAKDPAANTCQQAMKQQMRACKTAGRACRHVELPESCSFPEMLTPTSGAGPRGPSGQSSRQTATSEPRRKTAPRLAAEK